MLLAIFRRLPLVSTILYFNSEIRRASLRKFLVLWLFSILPLLFAGLRSVVHPDAFVLSAYFDGVLSEFKTKSLFVFSISFLVPMLYLTYERVTTYIKYAFSHKQAPEHIGFPHGYGFVLITSVVVFLLTAFVYGSESSSTNTVLAYLLDCGLVYFVYGFALYCWYVTILMSKLEKDGPDFVADSRRQEQSLTNKLSDRLMKGGGDDH
jgi:hypothetical protein